MEGDSQRDQHSQYSCISIHALRVEGDDLRRDAQGKHRDFYPRPPGGGRQPKRRRRKLVAYFYPRPPGGGRPKGVKHNWFCPEYFYPRPPGGGRPYMLNEIGVVADFYPRPPGGGRLSKRSTQPIQLHFYPRPPGGGRLPRPRKCAGSLLISIHALRVEGDAALVQSPLKNKISIHALRVEGDCAPPGSVI